MGGVSFDFISHGRNLQVTVTLAPDELASLTLDGTIELAGDLQSDLRLEFSKNSTLTRCRSTRVKAQNHQALGAGVEAPASRGPLRRPRALTGSGADRCVGYSRGGARIDAHRWAGANWGFHDGVLTVERLMLTAEDSHVSLRHH